MNKKIYNNLKKEQREKKKRNEEIAEEEVYDIIKMIIFSAVGYYNI